jgi:serine/threonine-protein kinase
MADPRQGNDAELPESIAERIDRDLEPGNKVGEYVIQGKLGEGGFGTVYRAVHPLIGKNAAVKVLAREFSSNAEMVSRFMSEARAVNTIQHANIIDIFNFGTLEDGRHYFVMELLEGMSLDVFIAKHAPLDPPLTIEILRGVARALDAAHAKGIVHRDLKPENIFLSFDDEGRPIPKLLDFGVAKLLGDAGAISGHKTRTGAPVGTPQYMSPEQCLGGDMDERVDVYAFGVVCFEMLTKTPPFGGTSLLELMNQHVSGARPPISERTEKLGKGFDKPLAQTMAIDRGARPRTVGAALDMLVEAARASGWNVDAPQRVAAGDRVGDASALAGADTVAHAATVASGLDRDTRGPASISIVDEGRRPRKIWLAVVAVLAIGAAVYAASFMNPKPTVPAAATETAAPVQDTPSAPPSTAVAAPAPFEVEFRCTTAGARAYLGDTELGAVPGRYKIGADDKRPLQVRAPGHHDESIAGPLRDGMVVDVKMRPKTAPRVNKDLENPF